MSWRPKSAVVAVLALSVVAGCRVPGQGARASAGSAVGETRVLCSTFPIYLFTRAVTEGIPDATVEVMLPAALGCPHDYMLTPQDIQRIASADLFVANGLGLEEFLGAPLRAANPKVTLIDSSKDVGGVIPGNPHLFASPARSAEVVRRIASALGDARPAWSERVRANGEAFAGRLQRLGAEMADGVAALPRRRIVTQHEVLDYLARDAGLEIVGVVEEAPGQEPSASQMLALVRSIRTSGAAALFVEPQYPAEVGRTIAREAGIAVEVLDPVATGPADAAPGYYERVMRTNLETLRRTLGDAGRR